jgi:hypothetical protein
MIRGTAKTGVVESGWLFRDDGSPSADPQEITMVSVYHQKKRHEALTNRRLGVAEFAAAFGRKSQN